MNELEGKLDIKQYLADKSALVNSFIDRYFSAPGPSVPGVLHEAMRYSLMAGGKRLRPVLAIASYEAFGRDGQEIMECATALEVIHTYSLIHDDLPAMDNDDLRRGRPTNHKVFGEAVAILAGDALLSEAFIMMLSLGDRIGRDRVSDAVREVAVASGPGGMVGGQVQDMLAEDAKPDEGMLKYIHRHKTGALLAASVRVGGILAGASPEQLRELDTYGWSLGLAFQIVDDILDIKGDEKELGKPVGSDLQKHKMTYPSLFGMEKSMEAAEDLINEATSAIEVLSVPVERKAPLIALAQYIIRRTH